MKHSNITKFVALFTLCLMLFSAAQAELVGQYDEQDMKTAEQGNMNAEYIYSPPKKAWLSGDNGTIHLCLPPTDYEVPQTVLFSGQEIALHNTLYKWTAAGMEEWANVSLNVGAGGTSLQGWTMARNLVFEQPEVQMPSGTLKADNVTNMVTLRADNGITQREVDIYPEGQEVQLLGMTRDYYYVLTDGQRGFVEKENVSADAATLSRLKAAEPRVYDDIQPGYEQRYDAFNQKYHEMFDIYGDSNTWPLEARAKLSQMEINLGLLPRSDPQSWINILPGEGDLSLEDARALADQAILGQEVGLDSFSSVNSHYYALTGQPDTPIWQFRYNARPGKHDYVVRLDKQGEVTESLALDLVTYDEIGRSLMQIVVYADPVEEVEGLTAIQAADAAWDYFTMTTKDTRGREAFNMTGTAHQLEGTTYWMITITDKTLPIYGPLNATFEVLVDAETGDIANATAADTYQYAMEQYKKHQAITDKQEKQGWFFTWPLEDLNAMWPAMYGLPRESDISQEDAIQKARALLVEKTAATPELLDKLETYTLYEKIGDEHNKWMVMFTNKDTFRSVNATGFIAWVDAATGEADSVYEPRDGSLMMWFYSLDGFPLDELPPQKDIDALRIALPSNPSENAIPMEEAQDKAFAEMKKHLPEADISQYQATSKHVTQWQNQYWVSVFVPMMEMESEVLPSYVVALNEDGTLAMQTSMEDYNKELESARRYLQTEELQAERGIFWSWSYEDKPQYDPARYGLPEDDELSEREAIAIAKATLLERYGLDNATLDEWQPMTGLLIDGMRRWEVAFFPPEEDNTPQYYEAYFVEIEASTGVVLVAYSPEESNG